jgi:hypothetical protein
VVLRASPFITSPAAVLGSRRCSSRGDPAGRASCQRRGHRARSALPSAFVSASEATEPTGIQVIMSDAAAFGLALGPAKIACADERGSPESVHAAGRKAGHVVEGGGGPLRVGVAPKALFQKILCAVRCGLLVGKTRTLRKIITAATVMDKIGQIAQLPQCRLPSRRMSKALCSSTSGLQ